MPLIWNIQVRPGLGPLAGQMPDGAVQIELRPAQHVVGDGRCAPADDGLRHVVRVHRFDRIHRHPCRSDGAAHGSGEIGWKPDETLLDVLNLLAHLLD